MTPPPPPHPGPSLSEYRLFPLQSKGVFIVQPTLTRAEGSCVGSTANLTLIFREGHLTFLFNKVQLDWQEGVKTWQELSQGFPSPPPGPVRSGPGGGLQKKELLFVKTKQAEIFQSSRVSACPKEEVELRSLF